MLEFGHDGDGGSSTSDAVTELLTLRVQTPITALIALDKYIFNIYMS